jgi:hypothetical protein
MERRRGEGRMQFSVGQQLDGSIEVLGSSARAERRPERNAGSDLLGLRAERFVVVRRRTECEQLPGDPRNAFLPLGFVQIGVRENLTVHDKRGRLGFAAHRNRHAVL